MLHISQRSVGPAAATLAMGLILTILFSFSPALADSSQYWLPGEFQAGPLNPGDEFASGQTDSKTGQQYPYWYDFGGHHFLIIDDSRSYDPTFPGGGAYVPRDPSFLGGYGNGRYVWRLQYGAGQLSQTVGIDINSYDLVELDSSRDHGAVALGALEGAEVCAHGGAAEEPYAAPLIFWCGAGGALITVLNGDTQPR